MIGCPLSPACAVAWRFGEESQQPIFPQVMHMRRWTQPLPIFRHSSQPSIDSGRAVTSIWSRWLQMGLADMTSPSVALALRAREHDREIARGVCPPRLRRKARALQLQLEGLAPELGADLDAEALSFCKVELDPEAPDRHGV